MTQIVGMLGALTASMLFLPQVIKIIKTKDTKSLSLGMYVLNVINNCLWTSYGLLSWDYAILFSQAFLFPMGLIILAYKLKYK